MQVTLASLRLDTIEQLAAAASNSAEITRTSIRLAAEHPKNPTVTQQIERRELTADYYRALDQQQAIGRALLQIDVTRGEVMRNNLSEWMKTLN
jgi:long-subunit acyl-CoA synthetase (AMP-forming)